MNDKSILLAIGLLAVSTVFNSIGLLLHVFKSPPGDELGRHISGSKRA